MEESERINIMVYIVGIGPGAEDYIIPKAEKTMKNSDVIIGFERAIKSLDYINQKKVIVDSFSKILEFIKHNRDKNISVAASGDPCFYGITDYFNRNFHGEFEVISGISSFQYLMSKVGKSWQYARLYSLHGREEKLIQRVKNSKLTIWLTDKNNTPNYICSELIKNHINAQVYVGENLSYEDEKISKGTAEEMHKKNYSSLCVVVIENGDDLA